jgi:hypothetical protein
VTIPARMDVAHNDEIGPSASDDSQLKEPDMTKIPTSLITPDKLDSPIGELNFVDGAPSDETVAKVYDHLDRSHAFNAYMNG